MDWTMPEGWEARREPREWKDREGNFYCDTVLDHTSGVTAIYGDYSGGKKVRLIATRTREVHLPEVVEFPEFIEKANEIAISQDNEVLDLQVFYEKVMEFANELDDLHNRELKKLLLGIEKKSYKTPG